MDAAFLRRTERGRFAALAREMGAAFRVIACTAAEPVLRERVAARALAASDASDAGLAVLEAQARAVEPPGADERPYELDTGRVDLGARVEQAATDLTAQAR